MTTGKTIALAIRNFVGKFMSLLFNMLSWVCHSFSSKEQASFNFMAAVTICSDFGAQENIVCHHFHPLYIHAKTEDHGIQSHDLWQIDGETMGTVTGFIFLGSKITADGDCSHEIKRSFLFGRKALTNIDSVLKAEIALC